MSAPMSELVRSRAQLLEGLEIIEHQLMTAHLDRVIWHELRDEIVTRFPEADANFLFSYRRLYTHAQAMRVRRLADQHRDRPHSLHWILAKISDDPRLASRSVVIADLTDDAMAESAAEAWTARFGQGDQPDPSVIAALLERLTDDARTVTAYVDKNLAHRDRNGDQFTVTYDQLERTIDDIAVIANDTSLLLRGGTVGYENTWVGGDWHEPSDRHCAHSAETIDESRSDTLGRSCCVPGVAHESANGSTGAVYEIVDVSTQRVLSRHRTRQAAIDTWRQQHTGMAVQV